MNNQIDISGLIGLPEDEKLEYKAVLPPARTVAQLIGAFANTHGGTLILGAAENGGRIEVNGLSEDFRANAIIHKALDMLSPKPTVNYGYHNHSGKRLFVIQVEKSLISVSIEGRIFIRQLNKNLLTNPTPTVYNPTTYSPITTLAGKLQITQSGASDAMMKFIDHYKRVLNIIADLKHLLFPVQPSLPTNNNEGKILIRILFSSCADNFETYLSDLLYEIYLAKPSTLKSSGQQVFVKEVLECVDIQEFITYIAKKKLSKLQRGSVKGFIADNEQIAKLNAINTADQAKIESILQIRHLYAHKNGIVDEKFLQFFPGQYTVNETHELSIDHFIQYIDYLVDMVNTIDKAAIIKYSLATV